ncbi:MAG: Bro-N domain-containing protein [Niveispirillum sp.]|uniref:BRO-N domain-containing protein n=1 Tax=Niveispirillum sp. TaxID=1917217 RepID=UPI003BA6A8BB
MSNVIPFDFEGGKVRVMMRGDEPWFVLADVCRVLEIGNPRQAAARLDDDEKTTVTNDDGQPGQGAQQFTIINESGLYSLILTSRKEAAKRFKKWVTAEVLPTIRRTGRYEMPVTATATANVSVAVTPPASAPVARGVLSSRERNSQIALVKLVNDLFGPEKAAAIYRASPLPQVEGAVAPPALEIAEMDGPGCLAHLLRTKVARSNLTMGDMVRIARRDVFSRARLAGTGVLVNPDGWPGHVAVASHHPRLQFVFTDTAWAVDWRSALMTLPSATISPGVIGFGGTNSGAIILPWDVVDLFLGQREAA